MSGKLVVQHTFLQYDPRDASPDSREDQHGLRIRSASDSALQTLVEALGRKGDEIDSLSTHSTSACGEETSELETSEGQRSSSSQQAKRSGSSDGDVLLAENLSHLASKNASLVMENLLLRKQCLGATNEARACNDRSTSSARATTRTATAPWQCEEAWAPPAPGHWGNDAACIQNYQPQLMPPQMMLIPAGEHGNAMLVSALPIPDMTSQCVWVPVQYDQGGCPAMQQMPAVPCAPSQSSNVRRGDIHHQNSKRRLYPHAQQGTHGGRKGSNAGPAFAEQEIDWVEDAFSPCMCPEHERTTVMLRNLPNYHSRAMLLELIDSLGFARQYDFVYLPIDFKSRACLGYAFVNLTSHEAANRFRLTFDGFPDWILPSRKVCGVSWSGPQQGLDAHIERYRNSPVMHEAVPDIYKPALFKDGSMLPFPPANRKLRAPRIRPHGRGCTFSPMGMTLPAPNAPGRQSFQPCPYT